MKFTLPYGATATLTLDLAPGVTVADWSLPLGEPLADPVAALMAALLQPVNYPPLASATVPGDRVALAVEAGLPDSQRLVAGVVFALVEGGTSPGDITVVTASNLRPALALLPARLRQDIRVVLHNPADEGSLQYLAADKAARPIYFNRTLCDADLVLPLSVSRAGSSLGYVGGYSGLFPAFADRATQDRFRAPSTTDHASHQRRRTEEANDAAWLLGIHFQVQVVPGAGDAVLHCVAGESRAVMQRARTLHEDAWSRPLPERASLTLAALDGDADRQSWEHLALALHAAMTTTREGGAIVLLSELDARAGTALQRLAGPERGETLLRHLAKEHSADAHAAALLAEARDRFDVYLLSRLGGDFVEQLGVGHVQEPAEIERLAARHKSLVLLGSAPHAVCALETAVV